MKLFDFNNISVVNIRQKECDKYKHTITLPKGYNTTPFIQYSKKIHDFIKYYANFLSTEDEPLYLQILIQERVTKEDLQIIYDMISSAIVYAFSQGTPRDREMFLGVPKYANRHLNLLCLRCKQMLNSHLKYNTIGFEVKTTKNFINKKIRMAK